MSADTRGRIFPYNGKSVGTAFRRQCRELKIEDLHFHDLRHEGTSRLFEAGVSQTLSRIARGVTPEMAAAASKLMRNQDLMLVASKCRVVTRFRNTIGLPHTMAVRLQPNHPTDDRRGILASVIDGLMYGYGDAVIGINPASDSVEVMAV